MVTLQEGKFYKALNGCMIGPMEEEIDGDYMAVHPVTGDTASWHPDGTRFKYDPDYVLIDEWQEVAMETGTLKELNVKPGDVVKCIGDGASIFEFTIGKEYSVQEKHVNGASLNLLDRDHHIFRILSRATQTPDLTAITTPFGLMDESTQQALRAHGGPYEYWYNGEWIEGGNVGNLDCWAWRVQPQPESEAVTEEMVIWEDGTIADYQTPAATPVRVTFNRINGVIDLASYKVEPR